MINRPRREHISRETLRIIGIPKKFHDTTLDDYKTYGDKGLIKVKNYIADYMEYFRENIDQNKGLFLTGSNGMGKTMLASILAKEAYALRLSVRQCTFAEYKSQYTRAWGEKNPELRELAEDEFNTHYKTVEFLVLEEISKEIDNKISTPILEDCLRYREEKGLVTIMCANVGIEQVSKSYSASVASLIQGNMMILKLIGTDRRKDSFDMRTSEE